MSIMNQVTNVVMAIGELSCAVISSPFKVGGGMIAAGVKRLCQIGENSIRYVVAQFKEFLSEAKTAPWSAEDARDAADIALLN